MHSISEAILIINEDEDDADIDFCVDDDFGGASLINTIRSFYLRRRHFWSSNALLCYLIFPNKLRRFHDDDDGQDGDDDGN